MWEIKKIWWVGVQLESCLRAVVTCKVDFVNILHT